MANIRCIGTIAVATLGITSMVEAGQGNRPTINAHLENHAELAPSVVRAAAHQLTRVFDAAGIRVVWSETPDHTDCDRLLTIHVSLMSLAMEDRLGRTAGVGSHVLGVAARGPRRVYVFWSRVDAHVSRTSAPIGDALGFVIAHELGHVLLPPNSHSTTGIMHENYLVHRSYGQRFTPAQAAAMRTVIAGTDPTQSSTTSQP
jgi:hypothetical protein